MGIRVLPDYCGGSNKELPLSPNSQCNAGLHGNSRTIRAGLAPRLDHPTVHTTSIAGRFAALTSMERSIGHLRARFKYRSDPFKTVHKLAAALLGDAAVGKTSLVRRFMLDQFSDGYLATVGAKPMKRTWKCKPKPVPKTSSRSYWMSSAKPATMGSKIEF